MDNIKYDNFWLNRRRTEQDLLKVINWGRLNNRLVEELNPDEVKKAISEECERTGKQGSN